MFKYAIMRNNQVLRWYETVPELIEGLKIYCKVYEHNGGIGVASLERRPDLEPQWNGTKKEGLYNVR